MPWVVVDWRPGDLPQVYGSWVSEEVALDYARQLFNVEELPDGICVRPLERVDFDIPYGVFTDG